AAHRPGALPHLLLHGLRQRLRALAQGFERAALRIHRAVGVALREIVFGLAHRLAGAAELIQIVLVLLAALVLAEILQLFEQLVEAVAQRLLVLPQFTQAVALLLALLRSLLWSWPRLRAALALVLALTEGAVAQIWLLADHVAELGELRHHVVVVARLVVHSGRRHLQ